MRIEKTSIKGDSVKYYEKHMDLMRVPQGWWLAHCISADFALGAGIAKQINEAFNMRDMLRDMYGTEADWQTKCLSNYCCLPCANVLNLVTKDKYYEKPTLNTLKLALENMKFVAEDMKIKKIAMPKIGCGLDRLNWDDVKPLIQEIFKDTDIEIMVCYL